MDINVKFILKDPFFRKRKAKVELTKINTGEDVRFSKETDENGVVEFKSIPEGLYFTKFVGRTTLERVGVLLDDKLVKLRLPLVSNLLQKGRFFCDTCGLPYKTVAEHYYCNYCGKNSCAKHRLPEKHSCEGHLRKPSGATTVWKRGPPPKVYVQAKGSEI